MSRVSEFVAAVPAAARPVVRQMLRERAVSLDALREQVRAHTTRLCAAAAEDPALDADLALRLETRCLDLLARAQRDDARDLRRIVQAACEYYVYEEDADGDFDSVEGLDDDVEVVNAALFVLGEDELAIQLP